MRYLSVKEVADKWGVSERSVRSYCAEGRIPDAFLTGKTWNIPEDAQKPERTNRHSDAPRSLLEVLRAEKNGGIKGGIYHKVQIELTYNSNHIEGSQLTHDQTRYIYEINTIGMDGGTVNVDDIVETANHFRCIDLVIEQAAQPLNETFIKALHRTLKSGASDSRKGWFAVGDYKKLPNEVGGRETVSPEEVASRMKELLSAYGSQRKTFDEILSFHHTFESIPSLPGRKRPRRQADPFQGMSAQQYRSLHH